MKTPKPAPKLVIKRHNIRIHMRDGKIFKFHDPEWTFKPEEMWYKIASCFIHKHKWSQPDGSWIQSSEADMCNIEKVTYDEVNELG